MSDFTADRLKIYPTTVDAECPRATVRTEVKRSSGDRVAVNYYMRKTAEGWKAWDVVIDGISYVNSYREDFKPQIESQGLDAVIKRLDAGEKPERDRQAGQVSAAAAGSRSVRPRGRRRRGARRARAADLRHGAGRAPGRHCPARPPPRRSRPW